MMLSDAVSFVLTLVTFSLTFFVALDIYKKRKILKFSSQLNGYPFYPLVGNAYQFLGKNFFTCLKNARKKYNLPYNIWAGQKYIYVTADPDEIRIILNHPNSTEKAHIYDYLKKIFDKTLLLEPYEEWKRDRKIFSKSFNQRVLNNLVEIFYKKSCKLIETIRDSRTKFNLELFQQFTMSINADGFSGRDGHTKEAENKMICYYLQKLQDILGTRALTAPYYPDSIFYLSSEGKMTVRYMATLRQKVLDIFQNKKKNFKTSKEYGKDKDLALIDQMLKNEAHLSDDEILQHLLLFFLASIDTTAAALFFVFTLLGMHPEVQERVYQEVVETVGKTNAIGPNDLPNLKYTEMAISESLRILPSIPFIARAVSGDMDMGTRIIPSDTDIVISIFDIHRNEKYWKDPLKYDPDRFLPEEMANRDPYTFLPFAAGPKNCIGMKYAMMTLKVTVANVIRNYEVKSNHKSVEEFTLESCVTLKTSHDVDCRFIPRETCDKKRF